MHDMSDTICKVEFWPVDVPITDPFVVATGARTVAENVFLRITLSNGAQGYGEAAPFPEVGGETREGCITALHRLGGAVLGRSAVDYKKIGHLLSEQALDHPAARCALETAIIDAHCRTSDIPMWQLWVAQMCDHARQTSPSPSPISTRPSRWRVDGMGGGSGSSK